MKDKEQVEQLAALGASLRCELHQCHASAPQAASLQLSYPLSPALTGVPGRSRGSTDRFRHRGGTGERRPLAGTWRECGRNLRLHLEWHRRPPRVAGGTLAAAAVGTAVLVVCRATLYTTLVGQMLFSLAG
jgi:hypothetical protein